MISVIVPVYKVERYLPKCIESLCSQTYKDIEIILVDDGSPDQCGDICDRYAQLDSRVRVIHQPNSGVSAARNAGLKIAGGEYIGFCDPDDFVDENMYADMLYEMETTNADIAVCGYEYYDENYNVDNHRLYNSRPTEVLSKKDFYLRLSDMPPTVRHGVVNKLFKTSFVDDLLFDSNLHSAEDGNFLLDYISHVKKAAFVHKPYYKNLVRNGSATHGGLNINSLRDSLRVHDKMYTETVRLFPELDAHALAFLLDVCTLKYNEAKQKSNTNEKSSKALLNDMRKYIRKKALHSFRSNEVHWKTKIYYLLFWIRK